MMDDRRWTMDDRKTVFVHRLSSMVYRQTLDVSHRTLDLRLSLRVVRRIINHLDDLSADALRVKGDGAITMLFNRPVLAPRRFVQCFARLDAQTHMGRVLR